MNKLSLRAIAIGGIVDVLLSTACGVVFAFYAVILARMRNPGLDHVHTIHASRAIVRDEYWIYAVVGYLCSVVGGYIAGRIAKHNQLMNGAASSWLCILIAAITQVRAHLHLTEGYDTHPDWVASLIVAGSVFSCLVGGYFARRYDAPAREARLKG